MLLRLFAKYKYLVFLLIAVIYGYWQLSFMAYIMKWDMTDAYFPGLNFMNAAIRNGDMPFWLPYQFLGVPIHADPQFTAWYPFVWLGSIFGTHNFAAVNIIFLIHVLIGAIGMYSLGRALHFGNKVSYVMAISYAFCGVFIGHAQHQAFIISMAWIPFIWAALFELVEKRTYYAALKAGLFFYLHFTGGYTMYAIVNSYMIAAFFIYHLAEPVMRKDWQGMIALIKRISAMGVSAILLSAGYLVSLATVMPYFTRSGAISFANITDNSFTPKALISFLFPYATTAELGYWGTDLSMSNAYFGIITLLLVLFAFATRINHRQIILIVFGIVCMMASMAKDLPVRRWLYDLYPAMNVFRHSSLFRYFAIFAFIIAAGYTLNEIINHFEKYRKRLLNASIGMAVVILLITFYNLISPDANTLSTALSTWKNAAPATGMSIGAQIGVQGMFQLLLLAAFIAALILVKNAKQFTYAVVALISIDLMVAAQLNIPASVISQVKMQDAQAQFVKLPKGFPIDNTTPIIENSYRKSDIQIPSLWSNLNVFERKPAFSGYNPFVLNTFYKFSQSPLAPYTLQNKITFLSDKVYPLQALDSKGINTTKDLFYDTADYAALSKQQLQSNAADTSYVTEFQPNAITVATNTQSAQVLTLMQNNYPGWKVTINDKPAEVHTANYTFMSVVVPQGQSVVKFVYKPTKVIAAGVVAVLAFLAVVAYLMAANFYKPSWKEI